MSDEIKILIRKDTIRDIQIKMLERHLEGIIISKEIMEEILKELEDSFEIKDEEKERETILENLTDKQTELLQNKHAEEYMGTDDDMPDSFEDYLVDISLDELKSILFFPFKSDEEERQERWASEMESTGNFMYDNTESL